MQHLAKPFPASAKYLSTFHSKHHNSTHFPIDEILKAKSLGVFPRPGKTGATRLISMLCIFAATSIPDALLEMQTIALLMSCKPLSRNKRGTRANCFDLADLILPFFCPCHSPLLLVHTTVAAVVTVRNNASPSCMTNNYCTSQ